MFTSVTMNGTGMASSAPLRPLNTTTLVEAVMPDESLSAHPSHVNDPSRLAEAARLEAVPVPGAPGYFTSDDCRVYSARNVRSDKPLRLLKPRPDGFGYQCYVLCVDGRPRTWRGHRIVAAAYLPPCPSAYHGIRHKDDDPANNCASNLEWGTQAENIRDRDERGRTARGSSVVGVIRRGESNRTSKLKDLQVAAIRERLATGERGIDLAAEYGVSTSTISAIRTGQVWRHIS